MVFAVFYHRSVGQEINNSDIATLQFGLSKYSDTNIKKPPAIPLTRKLALSTCDSWKKLINQFRHDTPAKTITTSGSITLTYSDLNSVGTLSLKIDPEYESPKCGDIIYLYNGFFNNERAVVLFRGTVVRVEYSLKEINVVAEDTIGMLTSKSTFAIGKLNAKDAISSILDAAGVVGYINPVTNTNLSNTQFTELYSNTSYLDGIRDIVDKVLINNGFHIVLRDVSGIIEITNVNALKTDYIISLENIDDYNLVSTIEDKTFNRALTSAPSSSSDTLWFVDSDYRGILTYGRFLTYVGNQSSKELAQKLNRLTLKHRFYPTQTLAIRGAKGIEGLVPGAGIYIKFNRGVSSASQHTAYIIIKSITHTWDENTGHKMDINAICDMWKDTGSSISTYSQKGNFRLI
jgi:hypothetical protein